MADSQESSRFVRRLNFTGGNLATEWKTFKAQFEIYKVAKKFADMEEEEQIANLLLLMGSDSVPIYNQFTFHATNEGETKTLANVLAMFDRHFEPVKNVIYERVKFNSLRQEGKPIHQFITELQQQASLCDYGEVSNDLIRDRIVVGVDNSKLREYLIDLEDLTLTRCIQKAKQYVSHHEQAARMVECNEDAVLFSPSLSERHARSSSACMVEAVSNRKTNVVPKMKSGMGNNKCYFCNRNHGQSACYARNSVCHVCKKRGHWAGARACKGRRQSAAHALTESQTTLESATAMEGLFLGSDMDSQRLEAVTSVTDAGGAWYVQLQVDSHLVKFKIDTGAAVTAVPSTLSHCFDRVSHSVKSLRGAGNHRLDTEGSAEVKLTLGDKCVTETVYCEGFGRTTTRKTGYLGVGLNPICA